MYADTSERRKIDLYHTRMKNTVESIVVLHLVEFQERRLVVHVQGLVHGSEETACLILWPGFKFLEEFHELVWQ